MTALRARPRRSIGLAFSLILAHGFGSVAEIAASAPPETGQSLVPVLLQIDVDGTTQQPTRGWRSPGGQYWIPQGHVEAWNLQEPTDKHCRWIDAACFVPLHALDGVEYQLDEALQQLVVHTAPAARRKQVIAGQPMEHPSDPVTIQPSTPALFLDYDITAEQTQAESAEGYLSGLFELGWVQGRWLADGRVLVHNERAQRLSTTWRLIQPNKLAAWTVGDTVAPGGALAPPVRFAGLQWGTRFDIRPRFITYPLPSLEGVAALPSVVDLLIDGALRMRQEVAAGAFEIREPPLISGSGIVELRLRDITGGERVISQPFSVESDLLRPGLDQWSAQAGLLRQGFARNADDYDQAFASLDYRRGLTRRVTVEGHGTLSEDQHVAAMAATWGLGHLGTLDIGFGASRGRVDNQSTAGEYARLGISHRRRHVHLAGEVETASRSFRWTGNPRTARRSVRLRVATSPPRLGHFALAYLARQYSDEPRVDLWTASFSRSLGRRMRLRVSAFRLDGETRSHELAAAVSIPFGRRLHTTTRVRLRSGSVRPEVEVQRQAPVGPGYGVRAVVQPGPEGRSEVSATLATRTGRYGLRLVEGSGTTGLQLRAEGSLVAMAGRLFASRPISRGFALVRLGQPNVRVYADNRMVGRTNRNGFALVTALRPFQKNPIRVDGRDLPLSARIDRLEMSAVPYEYGAVLLDFPVTSQANSHFYITLEDGSPAPLGARVERSTGKVSSQVGLGGAIYLEGLDEDEHLILRWGTASCVLKVSPTPMTASRAARTHTCRDPA